MTKQIFVQEYTRADGTKVRSHYRNIEETANMLSQGNSQGALDLINQTLSTIPEEKNALAQLFSEGDLTPDEKTTLMEQLQYLQSFQNEAGRYQSLASNNLDTTSAADRIKEMFLGQPTGAAAEIRNQPLKYTEMTSDGYKHNDAYEDLGLLDKMSLNLKTSGLSHFVFPNATDNYRNSIKNIESAAKDKNATIITNFDDIKNDDFKNLLSKAGISKEQIGVVYTPQSDISKKISSSPTIENFINKNIEALKQGKIKTAVIDLNIKDGLSRNQADLNLGYQHVTLYNPKITNGIFTAQVFDLWDYEKMKNKSVVAKINNEAYEFQKKGVLKPYYSIIPIGKVLNDDKR